MIIPDVNVLVQAYRSDAPEHRACRAWLESATNGPELLGVSDLVLSAVVRIASHPRIFRTPSRASDVVAVLEQLRQQPGVAVVTAGPRHWQIFGQFGETAGVRGNLVPDAFHAALAIEQGATLVTLDRGFARFPGLRWELPGGLSRAAT